MASQGPLYPSTAVDAGGGGTSWTSPSNATSEDATAATCALAAGAATAILRVSNFGFSVSGTIDGFVLQVNRRLAGPSLLIEDSSVLLRKPDGTPSTDRAATGAWPMLYAYEEYGGSGDLWGLTITDAEVNNASFAAQLVAVNLSGADAGTAEVEYFRLTVYYTTGGGGYTDDMLPRQNPVQRLSQTRVVPYRVG